LNNRSVSWQAKLRIICRNYNAKRYMSQSQKTHCDQMTVLVVFWLSSAFIRVHPRFHFFCSLGVTA